MDHVFLSFSFRQEDRDLVHRVRALIESLGLRIVTGEDLGGEALTPEVMRRIEESSGVVALMTPRDQMASGSFRTHPWVRDELNHARAHGKPAIAVIDSTVDVEGAYQERERITLDTQNPLDAFLKLMRTLGRWKRDAGELVKVRLTPDDVIGRAALPGAHGECLYRLNARGAAGPWSKVDLFREEGGVFAYLQGVQRESLFEIQVKMNGETWLSPAMPQYFSAKLDRMGGE